MIILLILSTLALGVYSDIRWSACINDTIRFCGIDPVVGRNCGPEEKGNAELQWYFDLPHNAIFPFKYLGCGRTNGGKYTSARGMRLVGHPICPGFQNHTGRCLSSQFVCKNEADICIKDYMGISGSCCSKAIQEKFVENKKAKCKSGKAVFLKDVIPEKEKQTIGPSPIQFKDAIVNDVVRNVNWDMQPLFGKKCSHNFCPTGSKCIDGEFIAYCCK